MQQRKTKTVVLKKVQKRGTRWQRFWRYLQSNYQLYLLILPALLCVILFSYVPMYGIQIAFKDFRPAQGIAGSQWVGMEHFVRFLRTPLFVRVVRNTLGISLYSLLVGFPVPILLAIMINEVRSRWFQKTVQMITYAPYFISTVAMCGMLLLFLKKDTGVINALVDFLGGTRTDLINRPELFWSIYVWSGVWQGMGWSSIIYIAALTSVDETIVEAALIDGANRMQKIMHIDLPTIRPTIIILLIMNVGSLLNVGYEKTLLLQTSLNMDTADVISTYTYRLGVLQGQYDYTTAIGLFNQVINAILLVLVNWVAGRLGDTRLW